MSKRPITVRRVKNAMRKAVKVKGDDYEYPGWERGNCLYTETNPATGRLQPSCIVGHALHYLGVPLQTLNKFEGMNATMLPLDEWGVPEEVHDALQRAQTTQDQGNTWGEALQEFEDELEYANG